MRRGRTTPNEKGENQSGNIPGEDDQQSTVKQRVLETVLGCLDEPLPMASAVHAEGESMKNILYKDRHPLGWSRPKGRRV
jgi:hypothetical protein